MQMINESGVQHCIKGERVENLYDRDIAEKAEINLLTKVGKSGVESFSLAWLMIDRQWQIVAFATSDPLDG
ncbi:MAG: hypothetical protein ACRBM6_11580 [Geminicoccales bacterium]